MISRSQLAQLFPRASPGRLDAVAAAVPSVLPRFGLDHGPHRLPFFLAQLGHESGGMTVGVENMNYSAKRMTEVWKRRFPTIASAQPFANNPEKLGNHVYANRNGNGNAASGDGFRFRGRGLIQLTGRGTYRDVGALVGLNLEGDPELAARNDNLLLIAAGFWAWKKVNPACDANDFRQCTILVNGGTVGMEDRRLWLDKARRTLASVPPRRAQPKAATVIAVQRTLQSLGFTQVGAADGDVGPKTMTAIDAFRTMKGLPIADPANPIDAALLVALGLPAA
jgi:putative chitinase